MRVRKCTCRVRSESLDAAGSNNAAAFAEHRISALYVGFDRTTQGGRPDTPKSHQQAARPTLPVECRSVFTVCIFKFDQFRSEHPSNVVAAGSWRHMRRPLIRRGPRFGSIHAGDREIGRHASRCRASFCFRDRRSGPDTWRSSSSGARFCLRNCCRSSVQACQTAGSSICTDQRRRA